MWCTRSFRCDQRWPMSCQTIYSTKWIRTHATGFSEAQRKIVCRRENREKTIENEKDERWKAKIANTWQRQRRISATVKRVKGTRWHYKRFFFSSFLDSKNVENIHDKTHVVDDILPHTRQKKEKEKNETDDKRASPAKREKWKQRKKENGHNGNVGDGTNDDV